MLTRHITHTRLDTVPNILHTYHAKGRKMMVAGIIHISWIRNSLIPLRIGVTLAHAQYEDVKSRECRKTKGYGYFGAYPDVIHEA